MNVGTVVLYIDVRNPLVPAARRCEYSAMDLDHDACYRAVKLRDARFDGRFFTAVKTTGIYCRPICPARTPHSRNVIFLPTAAAAQEAGFSALSAMPTRDRTGHASVARHLQQRLAGPGVD